MSIDNDSEKINVVCDYCGNNAVLVTGKDLYPHRPDLYQVKAWECKPCKASVGCHKNSKKNAPLGRLANTELKKLKMAAHSAFDPLWKSGRYGRKAAYKMLAGKLGIEFKDCHIGMFNEEMCKKVIQVLRSES